jgi:hypothetical protein
VKHVGGDVDGLAVDLVGPAGVVAEAADDGADVATGHGDGLAIVERLDGGQQVQVLLSEVGQLAKILAALLGRGLLPCCVEGFAGGGDGQVDVLLAGLGDGGDNLLGSGVDDVEGLLVDALYPLIVDEPER